MTQIEYAKENKVTDEMIAAARQEGYDPSFIMHNIAKGKIIIPNNSKWKGNIVAIGAGLRTKVNASIGTSSDIIDIDSEVRKARIAEETGADTLMELSVGGDLDKIRREIISATNLPVGTVPLYQAFYEAIRRHNTPYKLSENELFEIIERQCEDGISFMAIHCGINLYTIERLKKQGYRYGGLVSKGGALLVRWMMENKQENPLYEKFDKVVDILKKYDVVLSLGNGLRAGSIHDSSDRAQIQELIINCELAEIGQKMGCQMMVEGPGHVPIDEIEANIILQKRMSNDAPYYMLGPIPTDITPGFDHISSAVGASYSARHGADLICYITPAEHLALPNEDDVKVGVQAAKIAAHIGDMCKYKERYRDTDMIMSKARRDLKWEKQFSYAMFGEEARGIRNTRIPEKEQTCTMCGTFCALEGANSCFQDILLKSPDKL